MMIQYLPLGFEKIIERLIKKDLLVHNFMLEDNYELYNPYNFIYNKFHENVEYIILLDVNIYQYVLNSIKKDFINENFKDAIALLVFSQVCEIEIDPTLAVYEKINYSVSKDELYEIVDDLNLFESLNNANPKELIPYVLGDSVNINFNLKKDYEYDILDKLTKYKRLKEWDSLYLMVLVICDFLSNSKQKNNEKLKLFLEWMVKEFRRSFVVIVYAIMLFGKNPIKKMMKYKHLDSSINKKRNIVNMTWDLYLLNSYFRKWTQTEYTKEYIFASNDKAFVNILKLAIDCQKNNSMDILSTYLQKDTFNYINSLTNNPEKYFQRAYQGEDWNMDYRRDLIKKCEIKLGI